MRKNDGVILHDIQLPTSDLTDRLVRRWLFISLRLMPFCGSIRPHILSIHRFHFEAAVVAQLGTRFLSV